MGNAPHDQNTIKAKLGVWCVDGVTLIPIAINTNGEMTTDSTSVVAVPLSSIDFRDANYSPCWMGVNSVTGLPCPVFVNAAGAVLIGT